MIIYLYAVYNIIYLHSWCCWGQRSRALFVSPAIFPNTSLSVMVDLKQFTLLEGSWSKDSGPKGEVSCEGEVMQSWHTKPSKTLSYVLEYRGSLPASFSVSFSFL